MFLSPFCQNLDQRERGRTLIAWCRWSVKIVSGGTVPVNTDNRCPQTRFFSISSPAASRPLSLTCKSTTTKISPLRGEACPYVPISCRTPRSLKKQCLQVGHLEGFRDKDEKVFRNLTKTIHFRNSFSFRNTGTVVLLIMC